MKSDLAVGGFRSLRCPVSESNTLSCQCKSCFLALIQNKSHTQFLCFNNKGIKCIHVFLRINKAVAGYLKDIPYSWCFCVHWTTDIVASLLFLLQTQEWTSWFVLTHAAWLVNEIVSGFHRSISTEKDNVKVGKRGWLVQFCGKNLRKFNFNI